MKLKKHLISACLATTVTLGAFSTPVHALDPFIGQLMLFGGNFCPRNFVKAEGQLMSIASNNALFSLYGTMYGGDGRTTFGIPDLRGRAPISVGHGPGLSAYSNGQKTGTEQKTLTVQNMPAHNHTINATNTVADKGGPGDKRLAAMGNAGSTGPFVYSEAAANRTMAADSISSTGSGTSVDIRPPSLAMQWCVATQGLYPSRN